MIKALWRSLQSSLLYLNRLDTFSRLQSLVALHVIER
jgi:hypothetical protein